MLASILTELGLTGAAYFSSLPHRGSGKVLSRQLVWGEAGGRCTLAGSPTDTGNPSPGGHERKASTNERDALPISPGRLPPEQVAHCLPGLPVLWPGTC